MVKNYTLLFLTFASFMAFGQRNSDKLVRNYFKDNATTLNLQSASANEFFVEREVHNDETGLTYFYVNQKINDLRIVNATAVLVRQEENIILSGNRLITKNILANDKSEALPLHTVLSVVWEKLNPGEKLAISSANSISANHFVLSDSRLSDLEIPAELAYFFDGTSFRLVYETSLKVPGKINWYNIYADATTGEILKLNDWVLSCTFEGCETKNHFSHSDLETPGMGHQLMMAPAPPPQTDSYRVFELPLESPNHGNRTLAVGPFDSFASPFGWHDNNGVAGNDFTITRGNNVYATEDANNDDIPGYAPNGGLSLNFDFTYAGTNDAADLDAIITNLFYMNNMMHDVWYRYGFTEEAGNFQDNNYNKGGADDDYVFADAQDGSGTNNANFSTPPDGFNPRMQMYIWTQSQTSDLLTINSPSSLAGGYNSTMASFAPQPPTIPITENLVIANSADTDPTTACSSIINTLEMFGKIAVVRRGGCTFATKVEECQAAGAVAVIIVNNVGGNPITMGGTSAIANIPAIMVSQADGESFITAIQNGTTTNGSIADPLLLNAKDSDVDNMIIAHEYGHGISNRLTGGPDDTDCLSNEDQMGEGWSDWFGLMMTIETGDLGSDRRGVGTYVQDQPLTGQGIRPAPYSTSFSENNYTYGATNNSSISRPHGIGFVWATMLWDLNWAFIDQYGFDPNISTGSGGNNMVMKLVMEGMKLQPCSPGMVDGRDAILLADQLLNQGANECLIWTVFANRGLGINADQGDTDDRFDQSENFNVPFICLAGLEEDSFKTQLNVYPNPTLGKVSVAFSDNSILTNIRIVDINGRLMEQFENNASTFDFDISTYQAGIYFIQVSNELGTQTRKIIKE